MKDKVKVSLIQFVPAWLDNEKSVERMKRFVQEEAEKGSELIVFPELANIGYITPARIGKAPSFDSQTSALEFATKYIKASELVPGPTTELLGGLTNKYGVYIVVGIAQLHPVIPATLYNSAVLIGPSGILGIQHKMHIPLNEKYYFCPGDTTEVYQTDLGNIGMAICYDGRFPEFTRILALKGAEIICSIWNKGKKEHGDPMTNKYLAHIRAQENGNYYLACNRVGKEGDVVYLGHSAIAQPDGGIIAYSDSEEEEVLTAELHNEEILEFRASLGVLRDRRPEKYSLITEPMSLPSLHDVGSKNKRRRN